MTKFYSKDCRKKAFLSLLFCFLFNVFGFAQDKSITGTILEAGTKEPVIGAIVKIKGTTKGTSTDANGQFKIQAAEGSVLEIRSMGYTDISVSADFSKPMLITLSADIKTLDEVIVVGYGTQKKSKLTGAIEQISSKTFEDRAVTNVGLALQGQAPGLLVTRSSSRPGNEGLNFQIRGATSINGGSPLIVIDGVPAVNYYSFQNMNPDDIENISVLKDASAAIYGSRAANGVILVTTKKGKGKVKVDYSGNFRFTENGITNYSATSQQYASLWLAANAEEATPYWWGWNTKENMEKMAAGLDGIYPTAFWGDVFIGQGNRIDEMFAQRFSYQHNLSISNKTDNSGYRLSLAYADNQGNLATAYDGQKQYNARFNYDYKLSDRLKLETGISFINAVTKTPSVGLDAALYAQDMPFFPAKNPYGQWNANYGIVGNRNSAAATSDGGRDDRKSLTSRLDFRATYNILKDLNLEGLISFQQEGYNQERYVLPVQLYDWYGNKSVENLSNTIQSASNVGYSSRDYNSFYQYYSTQLNYNKSLGHHNFSAAAGVNAEKTQIQVLSGSRAFFTDLGVYDLNASDPTTSFNGGGKSQFGNFSYLGIFNYDYDGKYLVKLYGRHDGASNFAPGYKFKDFGGVELGWTFSKENFLKENSVLSFGKLRVSSGVSGNYTGIGNYDYVSTINQGTAVLGQTPANQTSSSLAGGGLVSLDREWERVYQKNIGVDLAFFDNRLSAKYDYFIKDNKGMLTDIAYPAILGATAPKTNSGELNVNGWEAVIGWSDRKKDYSYNISVNIGDTRSKLMRKEGADTYGAGKNNLNGYPLNSWFLFQTDGYFKDQAEIDAYYAANAAGKQEMDRVVKGTASQLRPGDTKRLDVNGDGIITGNGSGKSDLMYMGDANPHYTFGINLGGSYKGFDLGAFFQGIGKQQILRGGYLAYPFFSISTNQPTNFLGSTWTADNPDAEFPRLTTNGARAGWNYGSNDFMLKNSAYMRLKSLIIGYTLPKSITNRVKLDRVRVYFSGNDLWEVTKIKDGYDPEMGETSQNSGYPFYRTLSFGVNVGL
jgi:TonB-linked SusC/RagA family outer membrane protein